MLGARQGVGWLVAAAYVVYAVAEIMSYSFPAWIILVSVLGTILLAIAIQFAFVAEKELDDPKRGFQIAANVAFGLGFVVGSLTKGAMFDSAPTLSGLRMLIIGATVQMTLFAIAAGLAIWFRAGPGVRMFACIGALGPIAYGVTHWVMFQRLVGGTLDLETYLSYGPLLAVVANLMVLAGIGYGLTAGDASTGAMQRYDQARAQVAAVRGLPPTAVVVQRARP